MRILAIDPGTTHSGLRKSQADGIVALRRSCTELADRLMLTWRGYLPDGETLRPTFSDTANDLRLIEAWCDEELGRTPPELDVDGDEIAIRTLRDDTLALIRWIREDGREAAGLTAGLVPATSSVCAACGHAHAGPQLGGICIGCPCPEDGRA